MNMGADLFQIRSALNYGNPTILRLSKIDYRKRRFLFHLLRLLPVGGLNVLAYEIVHCIENMIEDIRVKYNSKSHHEHIEDNYVVDYNATCQRFHQLEPETILEISRRINEKRRETELYQNPDLFHSNFMTELQFDKSMMSGGSRGSSKVSFIGVDQEESFEASMISDFESELSMSGFGGYNLERRTTYEAPDVLGNFKKKSLDPTQEEMKFKGKLVYLREQLKPPNFITVNVHQKSMRSRCPIICASGFLSKNKIMDQEWQMMTQEFPFTEIVSIQWDSSHIKEMVVESADLLTIFLGPVEGIMAQGGIMAYKCIDNLYQKYSEPKPPTEEEIMAEEDRKHRERLQREGRNLDNNSSQRVSSMSQGNPMDEERTGKDLEAPLIDQESILDMEFNYNELEDDWEPEKSDESSPRPIYQTLEQDGALSKLGNMGWIFAKTVSGFVVDGIAKYGTKYTKHAPKFKKLYDYSIGTSSVYSDNPFTITYQKAKQTGDYIGLMLDKVNLFNDTAVCMVGYSLGSLLMFDALLTLYDLAAPVVIGDVCLLGSVVSVNEFYDNIHKLIGTKGVVQGKLTVVYTIHDTVLAYLFRVVKLGQTPIGLKPLDKSAIVRALMTNDPELSKWSQHEVREYVNNKMTNLDGSDYISSHGDHMKQIHKTMARVDFNNDANHFKATPFV